MRTRAVAHAHPASGPLDQITPRQAFDELARRKVETLGDTPEARTAAEQCRLFADAVDGSGTGLAYGDAVVLVGDAGTVIAPAREFATTPLYWHAQIGRAQVEIDGNDLMAWLHSD